MAAVPVGPFVRFVIMATSAVWSNWDSIVGQFDRAETDESTPIYGYYVQHIWQMKDSTGAFSDRERAMVGVHWINSTGGDLDTTWTSADFALVEGGFQSFWTALSAFISNDYRLVEHRWYAFGPGVHPPNPPVRVTVIGSPLVGGATTVIPHQVAQTLTFRTPLRRHWGRIYTPAVMGSTLSPGGQLSSGNVSTMASSGSTYLKCGVANGLAPVVWDRNRKSALGITAVESDSVPDIIRRRRPRLSASRTILTA